eukprot:m.216391 g.216391  ORF g.216391 m.216391 type:complete len:118 (+) comp10784_c0_seq3:4553-4906(+)
MMFQLRGEVGRLRAELDPAMRDVPVEEHERSSFAIPNDTERAHRHSSIASTSSVTPFRLRSSFRRPRSASINSRMSHDKHTLDVLNLAAMSGSREPTVAEEQEDRHAPRPSIVLDLL